MIVNNCYEILRKFDVYLRALGVMSSNNWMIGLVHLKRVGSSSVGSGSPGVLMCHRSLLLSYFTSFWEF